MTEFFDELPTIRNAFSIYEDFKKKQAAKPNSKMEDFFLAHTSKGYEFIDKAGLKSRWLIFKSKWLRSSKARDAIDSEKNISAVKEVMQRALNIDDRFFQLLERERSSGKGGNEHISKENLLGFLEEISKSLLESSQEIILPTLKSKTISLRAKGAQADQVAAYSSVFFDKINKESYEISTRLQLVLSIKFSQEEHAAILNFLRCYAEAPNVIDIFEQAEKENTPESKLKAKEELRLALTKASYILSEAQAPLINDILRKLEPQSLHQTQWKEADVFKQFACVFGDSFLKNSGLENDISAQSYINLVLGFIEEKELKSEGSQYIKHILSHSIDLRAMDPSQDILSNIKNALSKMPERQQKCLLLGGWEGHAIIYEISKQKNGKYTFRIYNTGEGIELHETLQGKYKNKYGCITIADIPEKLLFKRAFFNSIRSLTTFNGLEKQVKPYDILVNQLLPLLGGRTETSEDLYIRHFLSPQRSGTGAFRSLQAFIAHSMDQIEYKRFKFEFKTHLLSQFLPALKEKIQKPISDETEYEVYRQHYSVVKGALEKYAAAVEKLMPELLEEQKKAARSVITDYEYQLKNLDKHIIEFERSWSSSIEGLNNQCSLVSANPHSIDAKPPGGFTNVGNTTQLSDKYYAAMRVVDEIDPKSEQFSSRVEAALDYIFDLRNNNEEALFNCAEALFKKIGSPSNISRLHFKNPEQVIINLRNISPSGLSFNSQEYMQKRNEKWLVQVACLLVSEKAYLQIKEAEKFPLVSVMYADDLFNGILSATTSDPVWKAFIRDLIPELRGKIKDRQQILQYQREQYSGIYKQDRHEPLVAKELRHFVSMASFFRRAPNLYAICLPEDTARLYSEVFQQNSNYEGYIPFRAYCKDQEYFTDSISVEDFKDLLSIHSSGSLQIDATLRYFQENPAKLRDPVWIHFLHGLLFDSNYLMIELQNPQTRENTLANLNAFFQSGIQNAIQLQDLATASNLLWIASDVQKHIQFSDNDQAWKFQFDGKSLQHFVADLVKLSSHSTYLSQMPVIVNALMATIGNLYSETENLLKDPDTLAFLCTLNTIMKKMPVHKKEFSCQRQDSAEKAAFMTTEIFSVMREIDYGRFFHALENQAKPLFTLLFPRIGKFSFKMTYYPFLDICTEGVTHSLNLANGFIHVHESGNPNSFDILDQALPNTALAILKMNDVYPAGSELTKDLFQCVLDNGCCRAYDPKVGIELFIKLYKGDSDKTNLIYVHQQIDGVYRWLVNIPKDQRKYCENLVLKNDYLHRQIGSIVYLCDPKTQQPVIKLENGVFERIAENEHPRLYLAQPSIDFPLSHFEDPKQALCWSTDKGLIQKIELPRLNLTFSRIQKNDNQIQWRLDQQQDWFVSTEQFVPHLGLKSTFIVLENNKGEKKVLLPIQRAISQKNRSLNFSYEYDFSAQEPQGELTEFSLKDNKLVPKTYKAKLYLAKVYLEKGMIDEAKAILMAKETDLMHRELTQDETAVLELIIYNHESDNNSSQAVLLRMHALSLLIKNNARFSPKEQDSWAKDDDEDSKRIRQLEALTADYLSRLGHIRPLPAQEELQILEYISRSQIQMDRKIEARMTELSIQLGEVDPASSSGKTHSITFPPLNPASKKLFKESALKKSTNPPWILRKPSVVDKLKYRLYRMRNTFPFNIHELEEVKAYFPLLSNECNKLSKKENGINNGLFAVVYYLALFPTDETIRQEAHHLLEQLNNKNILPSASQPTARKQQHSSKTQNSAPVISSIDQGIQELYPLQLVVPGERTLFLEKDAGLRSLREKYFTEKVGETPSTVADIAQSLFTGKSPEITDPTVEQKFLETQNDIEKALGNIKNTHYSLTGDSQSLNGLEQELLEKRSKEVQLLNDQRDIILQTVHTALSADPTSQMQFASGKRAYPSIDELCLFCSRNNFDTFFERIYPEIGKTGRDKLKEAIKNYLVQKQSVQQLNRSIDLTHSLQKENLSLQQAQEKGDSNTAKAIESDIKAIENNLAMQLSATRAYDVDTDKNALVYLICETTLNIKLRDDQVKSIKEFADGIENNQEVVLQIIMGAGKSAVLQPILSFLFAKPDSLSTTVVPESLFPKTKEYLFNTLGAAFSQCVFTLPYNRDLTRNTTYLNIYLGRLREAQANGACLLLTPNEKHSLLTSLYEAYFDAGKQTSREAEKRLNLICEICKIFQFQELGQIDEIDLVMNPQVIFKYPLGKKETIDHERATIISEMLLRLALDEEVCQKVSIDFIDAFRARRDATYTKQGASLTQDLFLTVVRPKLVEITCNILARKLGEDSFGSVLKEDRQNENFIYNYLMASTPFDELLQTDLTPEDEVHITQELEKLKSEDLLRLISSDQTEKTEKLVAKKIQYKRERDKFIEEIGANLGHPELKELLASCSLTITKILPKSLFKICGANYGAKLKEQNGQIVQEIDQDAYVAIPYEAPTVPKKTINSSPYEQLIYTIQKSLYYGIPEKAALKMILQLQENAQIEMKSAQCLLIDTPSFKKFLYIFGDNASKFSLLQKPPSKDFIKAFQTLASKNPVPFMDFMQRLVFPQISLYQESLSSTAQTLAGSAKLSCGYTGTMHTGILSRSMQPSPALGTDGKTIVAVESKMREGVSKTSVASENTEVSLPEHAIQSFLEDPEMFVFIDSGGWLKEENIHHYAKQLLEKCQKSGSRNDIKGIVYHDEQGSLVSLEKTADGRFVSMPLAQSQYKTANGELLTIIAQRYETGTDIPQKPTAKAFMSIRKNMTLRDGLQSIFRMRQILSGQSVSFALSSEVSEHIALSIIQGLLTRKEFKDLLRLEANLNEVKISKTLNELNIPNTIRGPLQQAFIEFSRSQSYKDETLQKRIMRFNQLFTKKFGPDSACVWRYFNANQARMEQEKNWLAAIQKMREVIEKPIRLALIDADIPLDKRKELFEMAKSLFLTSSTDSPFREMSSSKMIDSQKAIDMEVGHYLKIFDKLQSLSDPSLREKIKANFDRLYAQKSLDQPKAEGDTRSIVEKALKSCVDKKSIPELIQVGSADLDQEMEQEQEVDQQQENEKQVEIERQDEMTYTKQRLPAFEREDLVPLNQGVYDIRYFYQRQNPRILPLQDILPHEVYLPNANKMEFSPNLFLGLEQQGSWLQSLTSVSPVYHLQGQYLLAVKSPDVTRYILVSHADADKIKQGILKFPHIENSGYAQALFSLDGYLVQGTTQKIEHFFNVEELNQIVLQAKICTGKVNYTRDEVDQIMYFIKQTQDPERTAKGYIDFFNRILSEMPSSMKKYKGSYLDVALRSYQHRTTF